MEHQEEKETAIRAQQKQLRLSVNVSTPVINYFLKDRNSYEGSIDFSLKNENYIVVEGGFGNSTVENKNLQYQSDNSFIKIGIDKSMLPRMFASDWDMVFIGARYGIGFINRAAATYITEDEIWGTVYGNIPGSNLTAHWAEINAGLRVELLKHFFAGYNIRAKFLLNQKSFNELPPAFVAGYGKTEKSTVFDFNFYFCYAIRW